MTAIQTLEMTNVQKLGHGHRHALRHCLLRKIEFTLMIVIDQCAIGGIISVDQLLFDDILQLLVVCLQLYDSCYQFLFCRGRMKCETETEMFLTPLHHLRPL